MLQGPGKSQPDIPAVLLHILDIKIVVAPGPVADEPPQKIVFALKICIEAPAGNIRLLDDPVDGRGSGDVRVNSWIPARRMASIFSSGSLLTALSACDPSFHKF